MMIIYDRIPLPTLEATHQFGKQLLAFLQMGDVVRLSGPLGMGKTSLVQGALAHVTDEPVTSPTFTLVNEYHGKGHPFWHIDLYRLEDPEECLELGFLEQLPFGVTFIEWAERLHPYGLPDPLSLTLSEGDDQRFVTISGSEKWHKRFFEKGHGWS